jgi:uncharacterized protein YjlB
MRRALPISGVYLITAARRELRAACVDIYGPSGQYFKYKQGDIPLFNAKRIPAAYGSEREEASAHFYNIILYL